MSNDATKILYTISKLMLICSYTITNDLKFEVTKFDTLIIILQISVFSGLSYEMYLIGSEFLLNESAVDMIIDAIYFLGVYALNFSCLTHMHLYRNNIINLLKNSLQCEKMMQIIGLKINYKYHIIRNLCLFIVLIGIVSVSGTLNVLYLHVELPGFIIIYICLSHIWFSGLYCCLNSLLHDTQVRFSHIHNKLQAIYVSKFVDKDYGTENNILQNLKNVIKIYVKIVSQCKKVNTISHFPFLLVSFTTFFLITDSMYYLLYCAITLTTRAEIIKIILHVINMNLFNFGTYRTINSIQNKVNKNSYFFLC